MAGPVQATAILIGLVVVIAAITDCWKGKIYNCLTLPALAIAPLWHLRWQGLQGLWFSLEGFGIAAGIPIAMSLLFGKGLGGGDIKLIAALGALGGPQYALWML